VARVSVGNCVSTAAEMLRFSMTSLIENAGTDDFDLVIVTWLPSPEVLEVIEELRERHPALQRWGYETTPGIGYVPNLRALINATFEACFALNDFSALVNTDQYFGTNWLAPLVEHATEETIVNSQHVTPIKGGHVITADCGVPEPATFDLAKFERLQSRHAGAGIQTEEERGGWLNTNTLPYVFHRKWWDRCGPWGLHHVSGPTPDRLFFQRCHDAGARFTMAMGSVCYHHEAVERRRKRPPGAEGMSET